MNDDFNEVNIEELSEQHIDEIVDINDMLANDMEEVEPQEIGKSVPIKSLDPDKPVNFLELTEEQQKILLDLSLKIQKLDLSSLDSESKGVIRDIKEKMIALDENTSSILNFFSKDLSPSDRQLINRTTLVRRNLSELYGLLKFFESKNYIDQTKRFEKAFKELVKNSKSRVDIFENSLKSMLSSKTEVFYTILQEFIQNQKNFLDQFHDIETKKAQRYSEEITKKMQVSQEKLRETVKNFETMTKKVKIFSAALIGVNLIFGICIGIFSAMAFLKYSEYRDIEAKMESLSQRISGVSVKKDENNHLILSFSKATTTLTVDENKIHLIIKEKNGN